ncbi:hypothetical protein [Geothrix sp. PMB-07]|uniref:hypothetical protein n=1 Tax=Geothrix sp. PMB-07 TaxID=3068640 RepID=UPI0027428D19|nr:hypothetical protein [Geothrix sp. PMB-07]WLT30920.1 hypothetical protein Q9293_14480 [Geothrix sp. PMB-07]
MNKTVGFNSRSIAFLVLAILSTAFVSVDCGGGGTASKSGMPSTVAPIITTQPRDQIVTLGQPGNFSVVASGTAPLSYQWKRNGTIISGATSANYAMAVTTSADNGASFTVTVSNSIGSVTSNAAGLTVTSASEAPSITTQPRDQIVTSGQPGNFSVVASGTAPLSYQWKRNGTIISGATSANYTMAVTTSADHGASFTVTVSNSIGSVTSNAAVLTVTSTSEAPSITTQPRDQIVTSGQPGNLSVVASGTAPLSYQWKRNGTIISGATSANYTMAVTTSADNGASFTVTVSNSIGSVTSNAAVLTVTSALGAPSITAQPAPVTAPYGGRATLSILAVGAPELSYQWYYRPDSFDVEPTAIPGATSPQLTLQGEDLIKKSDGLIWVKVSNTFGSIDSEVVFVRVAPFRIDSISPLSARQGDIVTVRGIGLTSVTKIMIAGIDVVTQKGGGDDQISFTVPPSTISSKIEFASSKTVVLSDQVLSITPLFRVDSFSNEWSYHSWHAQDQPAVITLVGSGFRDLVSASHNGKPLTITSRTETSVTFALPYYWQGGRGYVNKPIVLVHSNGHQMETTQSWKVVHKMIFTDPNNGSIGGLYSGAIAWGERPYLANFLAFTTNLKIRFANGVEVVVDPIDLSKIGQNLPFLVPQNASTGTIVILGDRGPDDVATGPMPSLIVKERATASDPSRVYRSGIGQNVEVPGKNLGLITGLQIAGNSVSIPDGGYSNLLSFQVPPGIGCGGQIKVLTPYQGWTVVGYVARDGCGDARIAGVDVGQRIMHTQVGSPYQRLVPGIDAVVRAYLVSTQAGVTPPKVLLAKIFNGLTFKGDLPLTGGPTLLPQLANNATLSYDTRSIHGNAFSAIIPKEWVNQGLRVVVVTDPDSLNTGKSSQMEVTPTVGLPVDPPDIVLVDLRTQSKTLVPSMPTIEQYRESIRMTIPVVADDIRISVRPEPLQVGSANGQNTILIPFSANGAALYDMALVKEIEAPGEGVIYSGVYYSPDGGGIGYSPGSANISGDYGGIFNLSPRGDYSCAGVMMHELSHNFNLGHVRGASACSLPLSIMSDYPTAYNGRLYDFLDPAAPIFRNPFDGNVVPIASTLLADDYMSYCSPRLFLSDFSWNKSRQYLEETYPQGWKTHPAAGVGHSLSAIPDSGERVAATLMIAGIINIDDDSYRVLNIHKFLSSESTSKQKKVAESKYTMVVKFLDGSVVKRIIKGSNIPDCQPSEIHFFEQFLETALPESIDIWSGDHRLTAKDGVWSSGYGGVRFSPSAIRDSTMGDSAVGANNRRLALSWKIINDRLVLSWSNCIKAASIELCQGGRRRILALEITSNNWEFLLNNQYADTDRLEITLWDGLSSELVVVPLDSAIK